VTGISGALRKLGDVVGEDHLLTATAAVAPYAVDGQPPLAVAFPGSAEEVAALLGAAAEAKLSVMARGAGSHLYLGSPPEPIGLIAVLTRLNQVVEYDAGDLTVTAQAGMSVGALQGVGGGHGQMFPLDPPGPDSATLGGIVSANLAGPMRMRHGSARDLVIGMRVALSTGEIIKTGGRTVKNVAGYDLGKLFVGSLGSAGMILEVTARLTPLPEAEAAMAAALSPQEAADAAAWVVSSRLEPSACEVLNHTAAEKLGPALPVATEPGKQVILVGLSGEGVAIERQERDIRARIPSSARLDAGVVRDVWRGARSLAYPGNGAVLLRASVPISSLHRMVDAVSALDGWTAVARAGDGLVFASPPLEAEPAEVLRHLSALRSRAASLGGHTVLESASVEMKRRFGVWGEMANADLMRELKRSYDPAGILGCGRFGV